MNTQTTDSDGWIDAFLEDTTPADVFLRAFENPDSLVFYWYRVLWDALYDAYLLVWGHGWNSVVIAVVIFFASVPIYHWLRGQHAVKKLKPVAAGSVGIVIAGVCLFVLLTLDSAFSLYEAQRMSAETAMAANQRFEPDTPNQTAARRDLYEFHDAYLLEAHSKLLDYADGVRRSLVEHSGVPRPQDQDARFVLGDLLNAYPRMRLEMKGRDLAQAIGGSIEVPWDQFIQEFESYYKAYTDLAEWTQRAAPTLEPDGSNNTGYAAWNEIDETFISELRSVTARTEMAWLRDQISEYRVQNGAWDVFRMREMESR